VLLFFKFVRLLFSLIFLLNFIFFGIMILSGTTIKNNCYKLIQFTLSALEKGVECVKLKGLLRTIITTHCCFLCNLIEKSYPSLLTLFSILFFRDFQLRSVFPVLHTILEIFSKNRFFRINKNKQII
jgi:hypothetical protein